MWCLGCGENFRKRKNLGTSRCRKGCKGNSNSQDVTSSTYNSIIWGLTFSISFKIIETPTELFLIMEYANGGELFDYIVDKTRVKEKDACKFF